MSVVSLSDEQIQRLICCPKQVDNPDVKPKKEARHIRRDFVAHSLDSPDKFVVFTRQSTIIPDSFTAGLRWKSPSGEEIILLRCNGSDHPHHNSIERIRFCDECHVHQATERYIISGKDAESFAEPVRAYNSLAGALSHLMELANISGMVHQFDLFAPSEP